MVRISVDNIRAEVTADARNRRSPKGLKICTSSQRSRRVCVRAPVRKISDSAHSGVQEPNATYLVQPSLVSALPRPQRRLGSTSPSAPHRRWGRKVMSVMERHVVVFM